MAGKPPETPGRGTVTVRYWAAAKAAAGVEADVFEVDEDTTLADLFARVLSRHAERPRFADVVAVCSVLVGDRPAGAEDPGGIVVRGGQTVELLPPFAGG